MKETNYAMSSLASKKQLLSTGRQYTHRVTRTFFFHQDDELSTLSSTQRQNFLEIYILTDLIPAQLRILGSCSVDVFLKKKHNCGLN